MKTYSICKDNSVARGLGWQLMLILACCLMVVQARAESVMLKDSSFVALPGHKLEVRLDFNMPPPSPRAYVIDSPPRLVLDLAGASNDLLKKAINQQTYKQATDKGLVLLLRHSQRLLNLKLDRKSVV